MGPMGLAKAYQEELDARGFGETGDRSVCLNCIIDKSLRDQVAPYLTEDYCTFCGQEAEDDGPIAASFDELMRPIMGAIRFFYERSEESLYWSDDITRRYTSEEVAYNICAGEVSDDVLEAIFDVITEDEWNEDPGAMRPNVALRHAWDDFRNKVKHEMRFMFLTIPEESSPHPDEFTTSEILEKLIDIIRSREIIKDIPAGRVFYRGRMVDDPASDGYDASMLGSPPLMRASANRMSPAGISMFYGCDDVATVVAEIGSHTVKRFAVIGEFETTRPLQMVNLSTLPSIPSLFDPEQRKYYYELVFLHGFARDLSAPVALDGREHIEYVPTQVVTEYMRWLPVVAIDGILFTSAQNGGTSCVIFCGPDGCADSGKEAATTILRLREGSIKTVRVVASPAS
jgi:HEPN/RES N-terminal domain 1/RES domain